MSIPIATIEKAIMTVDKMIAAIQISAKDLIIHGSQTKNEQQITQSDLASAAMPAKAPKQAQKDSSAKKEQKTKGGGGGGGGAQAPETPADIFSKCCMRVGQIKEVAPLEGSANLYKCQVDVGDGDIRQIMAGLQQYVTVQLLQDAKVVVVANLKPAKLAGNVSSGMILAGEKRGNDGSVTVRPLIPPPDADVGSQVSLEGSESSTSYPKEMRSTHWKKIAEGLKSGAGCSAQFMGINMVAGSGGVKVSEEVGEGCVIK